MVIKKFYASLNILYLKMYQYEKYVRKDFIDDIINQINKDLELIEKKYAEEMDICSITLSDIFSMSVINTAFNHDLGTEIIETQLYCDLNKVNKLRKEIFKAPYKLVS